MNNDAKIAYVKHPVSPEKKAKLRADGKTIIDIVYKPKAEGKSEPADSKEGAG